MTHDIVLFDLDGTLSDPAEGIARCLNHALTAYGYPPLPLQEVGEWIGPPLDQTLASLTGRTPETGLLDLVRRFRERYARIGFAENVLYPGVADALARLSAGGLRMAVCTAKRTDLARQVLDRFGLLHHFAFVDGGDVGIAKWQQVEALRRDGRVTERSLLIGDRGGDLYAANRSGLAGGAVLWGYGSRDELQTGNPSYWFETPAQWLRLLETEQSSPDEG